MSDNKEIPASATEESVDDVETVEDAKKNAEDARSIEKAEEAKLRARMPLMNRPTSAFLQKRIGKGQKYFDSGDYQMAMQNSKKSRIPPMLAHSTGGTIPTIESVPARKTSIIQGKQGPPALS